MRHLIVTLALVFTLVACNGGNRITLDGSMDGPANCHYDCTSQVQCRTGIAYQRDPVSVPCEAWQGSCAGTAHACSTGCDLDFSAVRFPADFAPTLDVFCTETPVALLGDSCARNCLPTRAIADAQSNVQQQYLQCDSGSNQCVAASPPTVDAYLGPCGVGIDVAGPGVTGVLTDTNNRMCLFAWDQPTATTRQGSTIRCIGDWECPDGSSCDDSLTMLDMLGGSAAVCRPGARGSALFARLSP